MLQYVDIGRDVQVNHEWVIDELGSKLFIHITPCIKWSWKMLIVKHPGLVLIPSHSNLRSGYHIDDSESISIGLEKGGLHEGIFGGEGWFNKGLLPNVIAKWCLSIFEVIIVMDFSEGGRCKHCKWDIYFVVCHLKNSIQHVGHVELVFVLGKIFSSVYQAQTLVVDRWWFWYKWVSSLHLVYIPCDNILASSKD